MVPANDQLTKQERLRSEALSHAAATVTIIFEQRPTQAEMFKWAETIETWLKKANPN